MAETDDLVHPKTDDEILRKVIQMEADGKSGSANLFDRMRKAEDFTIGGDLQWEPGVKEAANADGKFTLTIPIVKPQINQVAGFEVQNPQDFIIENTQGGAATIALILTALTKQVADSERARYEKSHAFRSGLSSGQGVMGVFVDKTDDPKHANLRLEKLVEHNAMVDPNATSYNINKKTTGAKYCIYKEWIDKDFVEAEYPDKKEELSSRGSPSFFGVVTGHVTGVIDWLTSRASSKETGSFSSRERTDIEVMTKSRYCKTHTWWREPKKCVHWYDTRESEIDSKFLIKDSDIKAAKAATKASEELVKAAVEKIIAVANQRGIPIKDPKVQEAISQAGTPIFSIEEVTSYVMHHTIRVGTTFLEDRVDELNGVQMYPLSFYWPYWINGYKSGISEDLIGTQEEINWTHSMGLNQVKQMSYPPVVIKTDDTGDEKGKLRDILQGGQRAVIAADDYGGKVDFVKQPDFPTLETFTQRAMDNVKTITGRLDVPEKDQKALSGRAKFLDIQKSEQGSMTVHLNWNYTLAILGDLVVDIIRKNDIFSEDEIREVVDKEDLIDENILDQAKGIIINVIRQQGGKIPDPPKPLNPIRVRTAEPEMQAQMLDAFQEEMRLYQQFVDSVEQQAIPIAEDIVINLIHSMKVGKYNTKVTTSPMAETMRTIKLAEVFGLQQTLRETGDVGLDPDDLIDATDVANKEKLKIGRRKLLEAVATVGSED